MEVKKQDQFLYIVIFIGLLLRFFYPLFSNPNDHIYSDPHRHYFAALADNFGHDLFSILDPPLPQLALKLALFIFGDSILGGATYYALLCTILPFCWYFWAKYIFESRTTALLYMAILTYLPSWIGIYSYYMDECLLLPLLGISLWLSWRAEKIGSAKSFILATIAWSLTMCTKLNIMFELVIVMLWLTHQYLKKNGINVKTFCVSFAVYSILGIAYLSYPLWIYKGFGFTWLYPPGMAAINRGWHYSNGMHYTADIIFKGKVAKKIGRFRSNGTCSQPFAPFSEWSTWLDGESKYELICDAPITLMAPLPKLPWQDTLRNAVEETLHLFFSQSWPDCREDDPIQQAQRYMRWTWSFLSLAILILVIRKRQEKNILTWLCLGTLILYIICNSATTDGRYRKPWEGIAIATFIYLITVPSAKRAKQLQAPKNEILIEGN